MSEVEVLSQTELFQAVPCSDLCPIISRYMNFSDESIRDRFMKINEDNIQSGLEPLKHEEEFKDPEIVLKRITSKRGYYSNKWCIPPSRPEWAYDYLMCDRVECVYCDELMIVDRLIGLTAE
jgi:hypothetical protein